MSTEYRLGGHDKSYAWDFIDIGTSNGGSQNFCQGAFGGKGIGIDIAEDKVANARAKGFDAVVGDARNVPEELGQFRYGFFSNILEHLPDYDYALDVVAGVWPRVDDFIAITGPNFDHEDYLRSKGFKRYFADWSGHTWHHLCSDLNRIMEAIGATRFIVGEFDRVHDSNHITIHSIDEPGNQGPYNAEVHLVKPFVSFHERKVCATLIAVAAKSPTVNVHEVVFRLTGTRVRYSSP